MALQRLTATNPLPLCPPRKLRRLNLYAYLKSSKIYEAENLRSNDLQKEEEDEILSCNDDFEVCSSLLTESDIDSHSDKGHLLDESKITLLTRSQKGLVISES